MDLILDQDAAVPVTAFAVVSGLIFEPARGDILEWFRGQPARGSWTLSIYDDAADDGGMLNGWSLIVVEEPPLPPGTPQTIFSTDFEADDGGFTHSGSGDEWERGTPAFGTMTRANSGVKAWKTDLDGTYDESSQDLFSPEIDLTGVSGGSVLLEWAMTFQIESPIFDHAFVEVQERGGTGVIRKVWEWLGPTMETPVGGQPTLINESAGWGRYRALIDGFAGKTIRLRFHLDGGRHRHLTGLAIDDVSVRVFR
jgi:hypothetical protein